MKKPGVVSVSVKLHCILLVTGVHFVCVRNVARLLSRPQTINSYYGFVCHDDVVVVDATSDYRLARSD